MFWCASSQLSQHFSKNHPIFFFFCFFGGDRDTFDQEPPGPVWKMLSKSIGSVEPLRPMLPSCSITQCFVSHITQQIPYYKYILIPYDWTPGLPGLKPGLCGHIELGKNPSAAVACFQGWSSGEVFPHRPSQVSTPKPFGVAISTRFFEHQWSPWFPRTSHHRPSQFPVMFPNPTWIPD